MNIVGLIVSFTGVDSNAAEQRHGVFGFSVRDNVPFPHGVSCRRLLHRTHQADPSVQAHDGHMDAEHHRHDIFYSFGVHHGEVHAVRLR